MDCTKDKGTTNCKINSNVAVKENDQLNFIIPEGETFVTIHEIGLLGNLTFVPQQLLSRFPQLTGLDLSKNSLTEIPVRTFTVTENLDYLFLSANKIHTIEDGAFDGLLKLKWLDLSENHLKRVKRETFANLPELKYLYLSSNEIEEIEEGALNIPKLEVINLRKNKLKILSDSLFVQLPVLKEIYLDYNSIERINNAIYNLHNLKSIDITCNKIIDLELNRIYQMGSLRIFTQGRQFC